VGYSASPDVLPEEYVPASVPGAVQLDWGKAKALPPHWQAENFREYRWMEDRWWFYVAPLRPPPVPPGLRLFLVIGGVDYQWRLSVDGETILEREGMYRGAEIDLTSRIGTARQIEIRVAPAPRRPGAPKDSRCEAAHSTKTPVAYGWDFHPRLVPLGVWEDCGWELRPECHLRDFEPRYELAADLSEARIEMHAGIAGDCTGLDLSWVIADPSGQICLQGRSPARPGENLLTATLANPRLWWPNSEGPQDLYGVTLSLVGSDDAVVDEAACRVGFRRVRLVPNADAYHTESLMPKSRGLPPMTMEINGRRIFCKGTNWVPPDIFPGVVDAARYKQLLELARDSHLNMIRSWGGGGVNKESFYTLCDEMGLLVWQEFPLACNAYPDDRDYLALLAADARAVVSRLRRHPCLAIWCGGNELFNSWSGMDDQSLALRTLNAICLELDPGTPFLPTSPIEGVGHGGYEFRENAPPHREVFQIFPAATCSAYTEFGIPAVSPLDYLKTFIPEHELWPPRPGASWEAHHAFNAWMHPESWYFPEVIRHYFGEEPDPARWCELASWLQCEGCRFIFEEARRQWPRCSMAMNWCFNEPWPTAAGNSLVNWPCRPREALSAVKSACRPVLATARVPKFSWAAGEAIRMEVFMINDSPRDLPKGVVALKLVQGDQTVDPGTWNYPAVPARTRTRKVVLATNVPEDWKHGPFELRLEAANPEHSNVYKLLIERPFEWEPSPALSARLADWNQAAEPKL
jgi:beta-mannosidase